MKSQTLAMQLWKDRGSRRQSMSGFIRCQKGSGTIMPAIGGAWWGQQWCWLVRTNVHTSLEGDHQVF